MGMFDYVKCACPLPDGEDGEAIGFQFQTKDTEAQFLDRYEIRADGTLWHEQYEVEDHSDPEADGFAAWVGAMTRVRPHWERVLFEGELNFYYSNVTGGCAKGMLTNEALDPATFWDYVAVFKGGQLMDLRGGKTINHDMTIITSAEFFAKDPAPETE